MYEVITPNGTIAYISQESHDEYVNSMLNQKPYTD